MDEKFQEERKKKDELLVKLKEIDDGKSKGKVSEKKEKELDIFFVILGNMDSVDKKMDKNKKKDKDLDGFLFFFSRKDSDGGLGLVFSKNSYIFTKFIENMYLGKLVRDDVIVLYIEKKKQQKVL